MIDSLCILGGGTSGCVTALMMRKAYPDLKITMIESSQLGIIGVGEGSTEHWRKFIQHIDVTVPDLIRETGATYKMGIKFTNWHGDGTHYFHSLIEQYGGHSKENGLAFTWLHMIANDWDPLDTPWILSMEGRHVEPLHDIFAQYHFDTFKLNDYLHRLCRERNITIVDTEIDDVILDEQGDVKELLDKDKRKHAYSFYIDCSGFRRVIASKLGAKWIDRTNQLPMNSALAFPTGYKEEIPSFTESTALSSGWVWRIPTQERFGNGYVFCDSFIDETKAYDEVSQHYKHNLGIEEELKIGRKVKFGAGHVDRYWIKNCVSIGLSGIFVEPLEASSIGTTIQQTFMLMPAVFFYEKGYDISAKRYNYDMAILSDNIVDFIQLHYFTERNDTEFWRWCKHNIEVTEFNKEYLDYFKRHTPHPHYFNHPMLMFTHLSYMQVMHGLRMFDSSYIKNKYESQLSKYKEINQAIFDENESYTRNVESWPHRECLEKVKERYEKVIIKF
jgi:tryptophan halogenase